jgi:uncharacterized protein (TIGR03067 family)
MTSRFLAIGFFGMLALAAKHAACPDAKKLAELDGTWTIQKMEIDGKSLLDKKIDKWKLVIKDGKITANAKNAPKEPLDLSKFLDSTKKPKTITYPYEGKVVFYGIYELKGDELHVCGDGVDTDTEINPESRRPKKFDSKEGLLFVFKREKSKEFKTSKSAEKQWPSTHDSWVNRRNGRHSWIEVTKAKENEVGIAVRFEVSDNFAWSDLTMTIPPNQSRLKKLTAVVAHLGKDGSGSGISHPVFCAPIEMRRSKDGALVGHFTVQKALIRNLTIELHCPASESVGGWPHRIYQLRVNSYLSSDK